MDYIFFAILMHCVLAYILVTYDIACQWFKNLFRRMEVFPVQMQLEDFVTEKMRFAIPKFHFDAHGRTGHSVFSLNYMPGAARTDGEGVE
jgi:hypothetical protein